MKDNGPEDIRRKLYEDYEDSLFKLLIHDMAGKEGELLLAEKAKFNNDPEAIPSAEAVRRFSRELNNCIKKDRALAARQSHLKILSRSAVAVLAVLIILGATVASVEALRVRALNLWIEIKPEYTSFQLKESNIDADNEVQDSGRPLVGWTMAYVPTYIPEGYTVSSITNRGFFKKITFENERGSLIIYSELGEGNNAGIDTENADVIKDISVNGHQGTLIEKNDMVTIIWAIKPDVYRPVSGRCRNGIEDS